MFNNIEASEKISSAPIFMLFFRRQKVKVGVGRVILPTSRRRHKRSFVAQVYIHALTLYRLAFTVPILPGSMDYLAQFNGICKACERPCKLLKCEKVS